MSISRIVDRAKNVQRDIGDTLMREAAQHAEHEKVLKERCNSLYYDPSPLGYARVTRMHDLIPGKYVHRIVVPLESQLTEHSNHVNVNTCYVKRWRFELRSQPEWTKSVRRMPEWPHLWIAVDLVTQSGNVDVEDSFFGEDIINGRTEGAATGWFWRKL